MKYVVKKTAMYSSSTYGPYGGYQEALKASQELENNTYSESFFTVEQVEEENKPTSKVRIDDQ
jgi:predicted transcriptional regulator